MSQSYARGSCRGVSNRAPAVPDRLSTPAFLDEPLSQLKTAMTRSGALVLRRSLPDEEQDGDDGLSMVSSSRSRYPGRNTDEPPAAGGSTALSFHDRSSTQSPGRAVTSTQSGARTEMVRYEPPGPIDRLAPAREYVSGRNSGGSEEIRSHLRDGFQSAYGGRQGYGRGHEVPRSGHSLGEEQYQAPQHTSPSSKTLITEYDAPIATHRLKLRGNPGLRGYLDYGREPRGRDINHAFINHNRRREHSESDSLVPHDRSTSRRHAEHYDQRSAHHDDPPSMAPAAVSRDASLPSRLPSVKIENLHPNTYKRLIDAVLRASGCNPGEINAGSIVHSLGGDTALLREMTPILRDTEANEAYGRRWHPEHLILESEEDQLTSNYRLDKAIHTLLRGLSTADFPAVGRAQLEPFCEDPRTTFDVLRNDPDFPINGCDRCDGCARDYKKYHGHGPLEASYFPRFDP